jgi:ribonuclease P/MRP protein subunit RPP40
MDVIYTDFSRAFDKIHHELLLCKLENFGLSDSLIRLIGSYLVGRFLFVGVGGHKSCLFKQNCGVPQGSVFGPLFFNMFINDIVDVIDVSTLFYADDLKIYCTIESPQDCVRLQSKLDAIHCWCTNNNLFLNPSNCYVMSFARKIHQLSYDYNINRTCVGVIFDSKLSFKNHIDTIVCSAFRSLGFVIRNGREFNDVETLKLLYVSYVRSQLEYASLVWYVQCLHLGIGRCSTEIFKKCFILDRRNYPQRGCPQDILLNKVGLTSLITRRTEHSVLFLFKVLHGVQEFISILQQISIKVPRSNARNSNTFCLSTSRTNLLMLGSYTSIENEIDIFIWLHIS